jgi:DNA repair protein RadA/Sms
MVTAKASLRYVCASCGTETPKWQGQCPSCAEWNTLQPTARLRGEPARRSAVRAQPLADPGESPAARLQTGVGELDRVLGGGLVAGSVVLIGGAPGIGKSTLLLQVAGSAERGGPTLYASGEESASQVALRARRLGVDPGSVNVLASTSIEEVLEAARSLGAVFLIVDSIQTMCTEAVPSAAGSPNQLRECAARLIELAKTTGMAVVLVGHVTKEGVIAGPRMLEHMVDVVLYFEDETGSRFRMLRAVKNRFGAAQELGVFAMTDEGLREVRNPSAMLLSRHDTPVAGSVVTVLHQGTRPLLVEVQALTDRSGGGPPRRLAVGLDQNRLALLLAALHRHAGVRSHEDDVFVNVVGGVRVMETAADLAVLAAVVSSSRDRPIDRGLVIFGEVGLGGEIRPVAYGEERLKEAAKLGFVRAVLPKANLPKRRPGDMQLCGVAGLAEALREITS